MNRNTKTYQPELPHDTDTERAVLATIMRNNDKMAEHTDTLTEDVFYYRKEQAIYRAITGTIADGLIANINSLAEYVRTHDTGYELNRADFVELNSLPSITTLTQDINRIARMASQRRAWTALQKAASDILDPTADIDRTITGAITALNDGRPTGNGTASFSDALDDLVRIVDENASGKARTMTTGLSLFDDHFLLRPGTLTVIAAFTSVGKTALAMNIAKSVAEGCPVAYYSLEMSKAELAARIIAEDVRTTASDLMNRSITGNLREDFDEAVEKRRRLQIYIDERNTASFESTVASIRTMAKARKIGLVIIDYLQIYTQTTDNVEASLGAMAREAKNVAMETQTAVILLSQLNRSSDKPSINMLRGSGQIEESADNVVLIHRPDAHKPLGDGGTVTEDKATLKLVKGRGVGVFETDVIFKREYTKFVDKQAGEEERERYERDKENQLPF